MKDAEKIRKEVSESYSRAVERNSDSPGGGCSCSRPSGGVAAAFAGYPCEELDSLPADAVANSFGCGNPVALDEVREGDTVVDLGSGAGIDILIAGRRAGPGGKVIGIDMTPAMIERARKNVLQSGMDNIEVRQGLIEELPVETSSVDLVISNCVINLSPEKQKVFAEVFRILKPGGRFSISDLVVDGIPDWVRSFGALYSSCISGAVPEADYLAGLQDAGLADVRVADRMVYGRETLGPLVDSELCATSCCGSGAVPADRIEEISAALEGKVASIRVVGRKP